MSIILFKLPTQRFRYPSHGVIESPHVLLVITRPLTSPQLLIPRKYHIIARLKNADVTLTFERDARDYPLNAK